METSNIFNPIEGYAPLFGQQDLLFVPLSVLVIFLLAIKLKNSLTDNLSNTTALYFGTLILRLLFCGLSLYLFQYHFKSGDIFDYHEAARLFRKLSLENPASGWKILASMPQDWPENLQNQFEFGKNRLFFESMPTGIVVRLGGLLMLVFGGSFLAAGLCFAALSFIGSWLLFRYFVVKFPGDQWLFALSILLVPSTLFWTSNGVIKEPLLFFGLAFFVSRFFMLFDNKTYNWEHILSLILCFLFLLLLKFYVAIALLFAVESYLIFLYFNKRKERKMFPALLLIVFFAIVGAVGAIGMHQVYVYLSGESNVNLAQGIEKSKAYNDQLARYKSGSKYQVVEWDGTFSGIFRPIVSSLNATFFRPYLWHTHKLAVFPAALESFMTILVTLFLCLKIAQKRSLFFRAIKIEVVFMLVLAFTLAIIVGYTSQNFGSLSRYKSTILPFYFTALIIVFRNLQPIKQGQIINQD